MVSYPLKMGRFIFFFAVIWLGLAGLTAGTAALGSFILHWDVASWARVTHWYSPAILAASAITVLSGLGALVCTLAWGLVLKLVGGATARPRPKARPQSRRRTTV